jgi:hypothetical protein
MSLPIYPETALSPHHIPRFELWRPDIPPPLRLLDDLYPALASADILHDLRLLRAHFEDEFWDIAPAVCWQEVRVDALDPAVERVSVVIVRRD